jgi:hypothetical protein
MNELIYEYVPRRNYALANVLSGAQREAIGTKQGEMMKKDTGAFCSSPAC